MLVTDSDAAAERGTTDSVSKDGRADLLYISVRTVYVRDEKG
jgi:hypothetical protein